jgi:predicted naringenin-chalcone synthase
MTAYVSRPAIALPEHCVPTQNVLADTERRHAGDLSLPAALRVVRNLGVEQRHFVRPLELLGETETEDAGERNAWTLAAVYELGERAARAALDSARLKAGEVDAVVAAHSSGIAMPGLSVRLAGVLGLRSDVLHVPVTQAGCAGGAWALVLAAELVTARPRRVLVVAAEALSSCYRPGEPGLVSAMYRGLFADAAAACVVSADWRGPGLAIADGWTYLLPDTASVYSTQLASDGQHFTSTPAALRAPAACMPPLVEWLKTPPPASAGTAAPGAPGAPAPWPVWAAVHPGGPRVIRAVEDGLPDAPDLRHSWDSLREHGNPGGPAVLDVLRRTHQDPPAHGAPGVVCGFGPGFAAAAVRGRWQEHPPA